MTIVEKAATLCAALMVIATFAGWIWVRILRPAAQVVVRAAILLDHVEHLPELRDRVEELEADTADIGEHVAAIAREIGANARRPTNRRQTLDVLRAARTTRASGA